MSARQIKALLVFPVLDTALAVREAIRQSSTDIYAFFRAEREDEAISRVQSDNYSIIITGLNVADQDSLAYIARLRLAAPTTPVVVVIDTADFSEVLAVSRAGVQDVVVGNCHEPGLLDHRIQMAIERHKLACDAAAEAAKQVKMKDQFLTQFSHELRSPITAIYQFITILLDGLAGDIKPEQREYLDITLRNVNLMREMVRDLMDVTRAQTGKLTIRQRCMSVIGIIEETVIGLRSAAEPSNVNVTWPDLQFAPPVFADPARIRQVLNNLCDNALKFCSNGDSISVSAKPYEEDDRFLCISVADTGCGISNEGRQQVFEYLYQDQTGMGISQKGLGIGLAICKELVTQHGGRIWVESEPGAGSIFSFILPRFEISELVSPLLAVSCEERKLAHLIKFELSIRPLVAGQLSENSRQRVWDALERESRPGIDLLLPRMSAQRDREIFCMVSLEPVDMDSDTIQSKIERLAQLDCSKVELEATSFPLGPENSESKPDVKECFESGAIIEQLECAIEQMSQLQPSLRGVNSAR